MVSGTSEKGWLFFTELVDAVRYSKNWAETIQAQDDARARMEKQLKELERLRSTIASTIQGLDLQAEYIADLSKVINEFVSAATAQTRQKIESSLKARLEGSTAQLNSEKLKTIKCLESYLAATPLPVLEREITVELSEGSYAAAAKYTCPEDIEYEFLLSTANSKLFRSRFSLASFRKGARIPVRLGKTWLKKEPVPDFERLEGYTLSRAEAGKNHLNAVFVKDETGARLAVVFSRSNGESFITVEYSDPNGRVDVTGEPALNKYVDLEFLRGSMDRLRTAVNELDREKMKLATLECAGVDVLATMDCSRFMRQVVKVIVSTRELLEDVRKLDPKGAMDRLKLLDDEGSTVAGSLGLIANVGRRKDRALQT